MIYIYGSGEETSLYPRVSRHTSFSPTSNFSKQILTSFKILNENDGLVM